MWKRDRTGKKETGQWSQAPVEPKQYVKERCGKNAQKAKQEIERIERNFNLIISLAKKKVALKDEKEIKAFLDIIIQPSIETIGIYNQSRYFSNAIKAITDIAQDNTIENHQQQTEFGDKQSTSNPSKNREDYEKKEKKDHDSLYLSEILYKLLHDEASVYEANFDTEFTRLKNADYTIKLFKKIFKSDDSKPESKSECIEYKKEYLAVDDRKTNEEIRVNYKLCLHRLFKIFARPGFTDNNEAKKVLEFLIEKKVEDTIKEEGDLSIIHWLVLVDNHELLEWAFENYYSTTTKLGEIFTATSSRGTDLFNYLADGIAANEINPPKQPSEQSTKQLIFSKYEDYVSGKYKECVESGKIKVTETSGSELIKDIVDEQEEWLKTELERQDFSCKS